ncbi:MAG: hypothetical protein COU33_01090 [Candidatus Magasanikbacteria bacterium CG10_big_fil_rev_8_21_14_0_10_43_6]|uniref:HTH arsR-type domain-containing protein n=1 Tax=Candidatus Magasanikbacteria bacterium CG10_big_fil_rev_8_21_14_0_10_43_6 TaxID=1974650 RepID=A0A2M6W1X6_9BACT|nr:MAG: hypothetical protein COU33_01090 [Candidatus Magasanikbacteria bacterium CG10_big_fil_rev_8_21_14_0_10_43_6]
MLEQLFGSKTRYRLLRIFFRSSETKFFVRELTRELDTQINAIRREISLLIKAGIIQEIKEEKAEKEKGPQKKYYILNKSSVIYTELRSLLLKDTMLGEQEFLQQIQKKAGHILLFLVSGCFTGEKDAPSDILLVGDIKQRIVSKMISDYEKEFGFALRYTFMTEEEFRDRRHVMDRFLFGLFEAKHVKIVNDLRV